MMFTRHLLLGALVVCSASITVDGSEDNCGINRNCCTAKTNCEPMQKCACSGICSGSHSSCECHCDSTTGGECDRLRCHATQITVSFGGGALEEVLGVIGTQMGIEVTAPSFAGRRIGRFHREHVEAGSVLHDLGRIIGAVPVFLGGSGIIEMIPRAEIASRRFSEPVSTASGEPEPINAAFVSMPVAEALTSLARFVGVDLILPRRAGGLVDGEVPESADWRDVMQMTLDRSGEGGRIAVHPNGLAEVKSW